MPHAYSSFLAGLSPCLHGVLRHLRAIMTTQSIVYLTPSAINSPRIANTSGISNISPPSMRPTLSRTSISPCHISQVPWFSKAKDVRGLFGGFHLLRLNGHMVITGWQVLPSLPQHCQRPQMWYRKRYRRSGMPWWLNLNPLLSRLT